MRAATIAALFGEGILVTLNATKLIMYWQIGVFHCEKCIKNILKFLHVYAHFRGRKCYYNTRNPPQYIISFVAFSVTRIPSPKRAAIVAALIFAFMKKRNSNQK